MKTWQYIAVGAALALVGWWYWRRSIISDTLVSSPIHSVPVSVMFGHDVELTTGVVLGRNPTRVEHLN